MNCAALALIASTSLGQVYVGGQCEGDDCYLATPRPYPANVTDSVHRPGFNGRLYVRRPVIGGIKGPYMRVHGEPGPEAYGAFGAEDSVVWARVNHQVIDLDPFTRLPSGLKHQERARQTWLRQYGFVGGVRTHVNDALLFEDEGESHASAPTPRATIKVPESWRRSPTLQVMGEDLRPVISMKEWEAAQGETPAEIDLRPVVKLEEAEEEAAPAETETVADAG